MDIKELQGEYARLIDEAKAFQTLYTGKSAPQEETNQYSAKLDRMDEIKAALEAETKAREDTARVNSHLDFHSKGTGHVELATGTNPLAEGPEAGQRWYGIKSADGEFTPVYSTETVAMRPDIKASMTPEYSKAFATFIREGRQGLNSTEVKALSEGTNNAGGFAVPLDFLADVIRRLPGLAVFTDRARHITTNRDRVEAPRIKANATTPNMYTSAVVGTMVSENPTAATGQVAPVFESVPIGVQTAKLETVVSRNLIADAAFDLAGYLSEEFRTAATLLKDQKFLTGTGVNEPMGIFNDTDVSVVNSGSASTLTADGLKSLIYNPAMQYQQGAMLFFSLSALKTIRQLKDGNGNYIWSPGFAHGVDGGAPNTIEGFPYAVSDFIPAVAANKNVILFGNPRFYWVIDRMDMSMQVLSELYAESNQNAYLAFLRFGGHVVVPEAFALQQCHT